MNETETETPTESSTESSTVEELLAPLREDPSASILADLMTEYTRHVQIITEWKRQHEEAASSRWNVTSLLAEGRRTQDNAVIAAALKELSDMQVQMEALRRSVAKTVASELNITDANLDPVVVSEEEKERIRTQHVSVARHYATTAERLVETGLTSPKIMEQCKKILESLPVPTVGRGASKGKGTPRFWVSVSASRNGEKLFEVRGFTSAALAASKLDGEAKSVTADFLREKYVNNGQAATSVTVGDTEFRITPANKR